MKKSIIVLSVLVGGLFLLNPLEKQAFAENDSKTQIMDQSINLTQEDAHKLLLNINSELSYIFQGNSDKFKSLSEKGLKGYVFLPDIDTDLGYFVDEVTSDIYYFHPSGYLELIK